MGNLFDGNNPQAKVLISVLSYALLFLGMYLILFRPQQKKRKQEEQMRKSIGIGDEIVTIGGIEGRVVSIKDDADSLVIETGSEKIRIKSWAVASVVNGAKES